MSIATSATAIIMGVDAHVVDVEAHIAPGLPATAITGLGDTAIKEARERMRAAFSSTGYDWPQARITIGLSPAGRGIAHLLVPALLLKRRTMAILLSCAWTERAW